MNSTLTVQAPADSSSKLGRPLSSEHPQTAPTELDLLATTDAQVWAQEFIRLHGGDEGLMLSWFANAIETGREAGRKLISIPTEEDDDDLNLRY